VGLESHDDESSSNARDDDALMLLACLLQLLAVPAAAARASHLSPRCCSAPSPPTQPPLISQAIRSTNLAFVPAAAAMGSMCSSSRNVESKKNKILEDAQKALQVGAG